MYKYNNQEEQQQQAAIHAGGIRQHQNSEPFLQALNGTSTILLFDSLPNESTRNTSVFTERIHPNVTRSTLAVKKVAKASNISSLSLASASPAAVVVACV